MSHVYVFSRNSLDEVNPLCLNPTKWSSTLKQFVGKLPTSCLSVFDHFVGLALKELNGLGIFHMSGNNTFKTSDFADPHFSFWSSKGALLYHNVLMEENYCEAWSTWFCVFSPKSFSSCHLTEEKSKSI